MFMFPFDFLGMETLLPFFLVLAIVYGALEVSKVFTNRGVKAIIAVVFAFFSVMNAQVVAFINSILPYAAGFFVVIFIAWIVLKPLRGKGEGKKGMDPVLLVVILVLVLILLARMQTTDYLPENSIFSNTNLIWIVGIIIAVVVLYKVYKIGSGQGPGP
jgi:hypothetical protein